MSAGRLWLPGIDAFVRKRACLAGGQWGGGWCGRDLYGPKGCANHPKVFIIGLILVEFWYGAPFLYQRLTLSSRIRRRVRKTLAGRADVDPADPDLPYPTQIIFDGEGVVSANAVQLLRLRWATMRQREETEKRPFLIGQASSRVCIPTAIIPEPVSKAIRHRLEDRLRPKCLPNKR